MAESAAIYRPDLTAGHYGETCKILGISRPTLNRRLRRYGVTPKLRNIGN